ncbi:MAG: hypothetical protein ACI86H_002719 [bacterium]
MKPQKTISPLTRALRKPPKRTLAQNPPEKKEKEIVGYISVSKTPFYSAIIATILLFLYEILLVWDFLIGSTTDQKLVRISPDYWLRVILDLPENTITHLMLVGSVFLIGVCYHSNIRWKLSYFVIMIFEGILWGLLTGLVIRAILAPIFLRNFFQVPFFQKIALDLGAGLFEEIFFRVICLGGLLWIFKSIKIPNKTSIISAVLISSFLFSGYHYLTILSEAAYPFTLFSFLFRFLGGVWLACIYLMRGFGIAALAHAFYDLLITINSN